MRKFFQKIKKGYDRFIEKIGIDKVAHFSLYGMVVAIAGQFGWLPALIAFVVMWILSIVKEDLDSEVNWMDVLAGVAGGAIALALAFLAFFI